MIARAVRLVLVLCLALSATGWRPAFAEGGLRVFLMGDSFAVGMAPFVAADLTKATVGGNASFRWESLDGVDRATRVVIVLGTNDSLDHGEDGAANYIHRVRIVARGLAKRAAEVIWVGPPCILPGHRALDDRRVEDTHDRIAEAIESLSERNVRYVGLRDFTTRGGACLEDHRTEDQVHFTARGYRRLVDHVRMAADLADWRARR